MPERWNESVFRAAAVASELVRSEVLDEVAARLKRGDPELGEPVAAVTDETLAAALVTLGYINRWQAEQLKAGRTRFVLGDYQIVDSIGQGGMGQVFQAVHTLLGRVEAIKVLPRDRATPEAIEAFRHEMRAQAQLDHPHLVRVSYAGHDGNVYFLVTEYVPGTDLRRLVKANGPLDVSFAASVAAQTAQGLAYIHSRGLVHRDVKPGNVLVTPDGFVKLSDMGLAGFTVDSGLVDPKAGKIVGTADYLAPEQVLAPRDVTGAADIYALGCTLYYAVTGKVPYPGGTTAEKARRHCHDTPLHPRHFNPRLPDDFVEVIADMMEKRIADRIQSAEEVISRLTPWLAPAEVGAPAPRETITVNTSDSGSGVIVVTGDGGGNDDSHSNILDFEELNLRLGESPSQISQATPHLSAATEDTMAAGEVLAPPPLPGSEAMVAAPLRPGMIARLGRGMRHTAYAALIAPAKWGARNIRSATCAMVRATTGVVRSIATAILSMANRGIQFIHDLPPAIKTTIVLSVAAAGSLLWLLLQYLR